MTSQLLVVILTPIVWSPQLSQILSALAPGGIPANSIPPQHTQHQAPPPFMHQPVSNGPHGTHNLSAASGYPLSAPPMNPGPGHQYGYGPTAGGVPQGQHHQSPGDIYSSRAGLAPPPIVDRMEAFSPGTVAVLNEVANHGLPAGNGGSANDNGRLSMSGGPPHRQQQSPMGASMSSISTGPPTQQQGDHRHGSIFENDFAKPEFPPHMMSTGHSNAHLPPLGSMHPRPGSESSPSTMNDGSGPPPGVSHVRTASFGWPEVSGRQMGSISSDVGLGVGGVKVSGNGNSNPLVRRRQGSQENESGDEDPAVMRPRPKKYPKLPGFKPPDTGRSCWMVSAVAGATPACKPRRSM